MRIRLESEEVVFSDDQVIEVGRGDLAELKARASANPKRKARLCMHGSVENPLHEMLIVHSEGQYVRPRREGDSSKSFHVVEGRMMLAIFEDDGNLRDVVRMGPVGSGLTFLCRIICRRFLAVVPTSRIVVFHETLNGPFRPHEVEFAPWSPDPDDVDGREAFLRDLKARLAAFRRD